MYCRQGRNASGKSGSAWCSPLGVLTIVLLLFLLLPILGTVLAVVARTAAGPSTLTAIGGMPFSVLGGLLLLVLIILLPVLFLIRLLRPAGANSPGAAQSRSQANDDIELIRGLQAGLDRMEARIESLEVLLMEKSTRTRAGSRWE